MRLESSALFSSDLKVRETGRKKEVICESLSLSLSLSSSSSSFKLKIGVAT